MLKATAQYTNTASHKLLGESYKLVAPRFQCDPKVTAADPAPSIRWVRQHQGKTVAVSSILAMGPLHALEKGGFVKQHCK